MDGDRYHRALSRRYQLLYKQAGQSHFAPDELAHNALRPLMKDAKSYGDAVVALLDHAADVIEQRMDMPVLRDLVDRDALKEEIAHYAQSISADPRGKNLALNACERYIDDLDLTTVVSGVGQTLIASYFMNIYDANFDSPAMTAPRTTKCGISHATVLSQLPEIRSHVEGYVSQIANSVAKKLSLDHVRKPNSPRANDTVGLDEMLSR